MNDEGPKTDAEICICAAIQLQDGRIIRGHRHDDCVRTALKWRKAGQVIGSVRDQGFVTSRNRFVGREFGMALQIAAGIESVATGGYRGERLFSEDLY